MHVMHSRKSAKFKINYVRAIIGLHTGNLFRFGLVRPNVTRSSLPPNCGITHFDGDCNETAEHLYSIFEMLALTGCRCYLWYALTVIRSSMNKPRIFPKSLKQRSQIAKLGTANFLSL